MYNRSLPVLLPVLLLAAILSSNTMGDSPEGKVTVDQSHTSSLTIYNNKTLVRQQFDVQPAPGGVLIIEGMPSDWQENSLELDYRDGRNTQPAEKLWWYRGGLDRDRLYRKLVGNTVELIGGGLNVSVQGTMLTYDRGMALIQGNNGRQYLMDLQDPQGFRIAARETAFVEKDYMSLLMANFGKATPKGILRLSYITSSVHFSSNYRLTLSGTMNDKEQARLELNTLLTNNSETDYTDSTIRLVSGDTGTASGFAHKSREMMLDSAASLRQQDNHGERVGEVLVTRLPDSTVIPARSRQQLSLYKEDNLKLERLYALDTYGRSFAGRGPSLERPKLTYRFKAGADLPAGQVMMYEEDSEGGMVISGTAWLPQTTSGDMARLTMGEALAVRTERHRIDSQQLSNNELVVNWKVTVHNDRKEGITMLLNDRDRNLLRLENITDAELDGASVLHISVAAETSKTFYYSSIYSR